MAVVKKTPEFEKIEQLAKRIPAPISWLLPDPYDPGSYIMPVGGLTKSQYIKGISDIMGTKVQAYARRVPKKFIRDVEDIAHIKEHVGKYASEKLKQVFDVMESLFPDSIRGMTRVPKTYKPGFGGVSMGFSPIGVSQILHEPGHMAFEMLPQGTRTLLEKSFPNLYQSEIAKYTSSPLRNADEIFAEIVNLLLEPGPLSMESQGLLNYIRTNAPVFIHTAKKAIKLGR